jgi:hydrogenase maturation protease
MRNEKTKTLREWFFFSFRIPHLNHMNLDRVEKIANAVLYEGYILYPYRPTAVKNQQRWNFGALCPPSYSQAQGETEACLMQTECLVRGDERTTLDVKVRFLHLLAREVGKLTPPLQELPEGELPDFQTLAAMEVGGQIYQTWQEAVEREVRAEGFNLDELIAAGGRRQAFTFPSNLETQPLREPGGQTLGVIVRRQQEIEGAIEMRVEDCGLRIDKTEQWSFNPQSPIPNPRLFKVTVRILNLTSMLDAQLKSRDDALMRSLVSTHTILTVRDGEFVSLLEPPPSLREMAASCRNTGTWPVLVGEEGERDCMLSSPIILYDYPQIAPESAGDLFDGTEIDEILTLRIMTLTDEEKREMRGVDEHARRILERTETLDPEQMMKLHGAMKGKS